MPYKPVTFDEAWRATHGGRLPAPGTPEHSIYSAEKGACEFASQIGRMPFDSSDEQRHDPEPIGCLGLVAPVLVVALIVGMMLAWRDEDWHVCLPGATLSAVACPTGVP